MLNISQESRLLHAINKKLTVDNNDSLIISQANMPLYQLFHERFTYGLNPRTMNYTSLYTELNYGSIRLFTNVIEDITYISSKELMRPVSGSNLYIRFCCLFSTPIAGAAYQVGVGNPNYDAVFIGYLDQVFGVYFYNAGGYSFTEIKILNRFNPLVMTSYQIKLSDENGFKIYYQDSDENYILIYTFQNDTVYPTFEYYRLELYAQIYDASTPTSMEITYLSAFSEVPSSDEGILNCAFLGTEKTLTTSFVPVLSIKNPDTFLSLKNTVQLHLQSLMLFNIATATKIAYVQLVRNPTLTGASFTDISTLTTPSQQDVSATSYSVGTVLMEYIIGPGQNLFIDLDRYIINLNPGDILTFVAKSSATCEINISCNFKNLF